MAGALMSKDMDSSLLGKVLAAGARKRDLRILVLAGLADCLGSDGAASGASSANGSSTAVTRTKWMKSLMACGWDVVAELVHCACGAGSDIPALS